MKQRTVCQNRIIALDRFAWPGTEEAVFLDLFCPAALWFREDWYLPSLSARLVRRRSARNGAQVAPIRGFYRVDPLLVQLAEQILEIYGRDCTYLDYELLQAEAIREQEYFAFMHEMHHSLLLKIVRPL